ncbi:TonB-dependent receptor [Marinifilum caeruleilacunae]|uniref:TonB-dependent receptor n=1 Tax=Marinifilum caeruleilacunae TaxID=2499076 RepID=A0ABX1WZ17_9BACT|nr:TonB-dependent receptor [Marinifilum caeruleilacunae]NOU61342.1 TonB-dependent receptor [Marinifilum caeruleilacunae]
MFKQMNSVLRRATLLIVLQFVCFVGFSQFSLKGKVTDNSGNALPGAAIAVKGTYLGTVTNSYGEYQFKNLKAGDYQLIISFLGYKSIEKSIELKDSQVLDFELSPSAILADEVLVAATRAGSKTPVAVTNVKKEEIASKNMGRDIPVILSSTPSFVSTTDAGAGVGYTGFRVRGTDANRINVTIDGIPLNDSESHGVFWVNMPDFASSVEDIQIQRGVGTSTNGAAAFGATINLQTSKVSEEAYAELASSAGSFKTFKNTLKFGTGLKNGFAFDARLSKITSDGFIDRAESDLQSIFLSGGYYGEKTSIKANFFTGKEQTYQAWNGVPSVRLNNDEEGMQRYADHWLVSQDIVDHMKASDSRTYNQYTYENETDNYWQKHSQLFLTHLLSEKTKLNIGLHYTHGEGYYEQYKPEDKLSKYGLDPIVIGGETIDRTDVIRRKWLNNDFYGAVFSISHSTSTLNVVWGGAWNKYDGDHYGRIRWMKNAGDAFIDHEYYFNNGTKKDYNTYVKTNLSLSDVFSVYADLQLRGIDYKIKGVDDDFRDLTQDHDFLFFNPKAGLNIQLNNSNRIYGSFAVANREPNRSNYTDAEVGKTPTSERLFDYEFGYKYTSAKAFFETNLYYMDYKDQLVLTGQINDVGSAIMVNVEDSYRMGIEISGGIKITKGLDWSGNLTLSRNKIKNFTEYVDDWDNGGQIATDLGTTNLAFSPELSANSMFTYKNSGFMAQLSSQFVDDQYIDNSSSASRKLDSYFVSNLNLSYEIKCNLIKNVKLHLQVNNLFDEEYESNAWIYSYVLGGQRYAMDGYFPQAGTNFLAGVTVRF